MTLDNFIAQQHDENRLTCYVYDKNSRLVTGVYSGPDRKAIEDYIKPVYDWKVVDSTYSPEDSELPLEGFENGWQHVVLEASGSDGKIIAHDPSGHPIS